MSWPQGLASTKKLKELKSEYDVIIPYYFRNYRGKNLMFAGVLYNQEEDCVEYWYYHPYDGRWEKFHTILAGNVKYETNGTFKGDLYIFGQEGVDSVEKHTKMGEKLESMVGEPLFMYDMDSMLELTGSKHPEKCHCSKQGFDSFPTQVPIEGATDVPLIRCSKCKMPYQIGIPSNKTDIETALKENWVFADFTPEIIKQNDGLTYYLVNPPESNRINKVLAAIVAQVNTETGLATDYNAKTDKFVLLSNGDEIVGFLSWSTRWGAKALHQVYVRPPFRRQGIARTAVLSWFDYIDEELVYADQMNEASRQMFQEIGLFADGVHCTEVIEFSDFYPQGIEMDKQTFDAYPPSAFNSI